MLSSELLYQLLFLDYGLNWLESLLMPLSDCILELVLPKSVNDVDESLEGTMALVIKFAVTEEFIHGHLLASLECCFKGLEQDLSHQKLVVMSIVLVHLGAFSGDLHHTAVICLVQSIKLVHQFISLISQSVNHQFEVIDLSIILIVLSLQNVNFFIKFLNFFMGLELL